MFYLFLCTAIMINTFIDLSVVESALLWLTFFCGYLVTSYLGIVHNTERYRRRLGNEYRSQLNEVQQELLTVKPVKGKAAAH
ncbi:hypothetical protein [Geobacter argillaceus]|uniref:Uncharacterized protein n=1 Tax=Geobacter argillaceus TaxID=345631 RepID=A0A562VF54_9BACT|nr:hypothetical protein [Geobacter argillaceus]TWJ16431.1 hypothetical protein JN12_03372 [Geobacter argillaceus]